MGAQKSVHAGKAKVDFNVDFTRMLCEALLLPPIRNSNFPVSQITGSHMITLRNYCSHPVHPHINALFNLHHRPISCRREMRRGRMEVRRRDVLMHRVREIIPQDAKRRNRKVRLQNDTNLRLSIKHPSLFGRSEKLDVLWDKGVNDSNVVIAIRRPRPDWLSQQSFVIQHSITPEIAVHGLPIDNFTQSGSTGVNLCRLSLGLDLNEPATSNWSSKTSINFEHIRPINNEGRSINRDLDGFPITCSGSLHDNMVVLKQETQYAVVNEDSFSRLNFQMEQGLPLLPRWLIFNRFKFVASKGIKLGPTFLVSSLTGGSMVGDMAPYQAFTIGGLGSVRGYGEGAVGSGRSCLVANSEFTIPLTKELEGAVFMDCGTDLGSARHVPGNPALRLGKPGFGVGFGYGFRFNSQLGQLQVDYAINAFQRKTIYFGINNVGS